VTYTLVAKFQDQTDAIFVQFIGEQGDQVLGIKASDFKEMKETSTPGLK